MFTNVGPIYSCRIMRDKRTGYSFGYGFVNYVKKQDAHKAINVRCFSMRSFYNNIHRLWHKLDSLNRLIRLFFGPWGFNSASIPEVHPKEKHLKLTFPIPKFKH